MSRVVLISLFILSILVMVSCSNEDLITSNTSQESENVTSLAKGKNTNAAPAGAVFSPVFEQLNNKAAAKGLSTRILMAEYLTDAASGEFGRTVYASDRGNKQLAGDFVPGDPRSPKGTNDIWYYVDNNRPSDDLDVAETHAAINRAMMTWDNVVCSNLGMTEVPFDGRPTGFVSAIYGFGGSFEYAADVTHCGWLPADFFDLLAENGSDFILGVTFTIVWTDEDGNLTDIDRNRKYDVAWREIYYNDAFPWNIDGHYDVETISLHEAGHGLSQAHFGDIFRDGHGGLHFAPYAVMNAAYSRVHHELTGTDEAGHCSNWAQWPMN